MKKIRLFVNQEKISSKQIIKLVNNDFNYLIKVMRCKLDDQILIFNGKDGQWLAKIIVISKKDCQIEVIEVNKKQYFPPQITLAFAPVKNIRIDFIAAKATEMGVVKFQPILTNHSVVDKINLDRFRANIKEAAEQCERLDLPEILPIVKLPAFLKELDKDQILILCDESGKGGKAGEVLSAVKFDQKVEIIIFIGPEGGFSKQEFERFDQIDNLHKITFGPRILRADTAVITALALVQEFLGDFN